MVTAARKATAPKPGPAASTAKSAAKFDFSALTVTDAVLPGRNSTPAVQTTPFPEWVKASWDARKSVEVMRGTGKARKAITVEHGTSKATTVPADMVERTIGLLREASNLVGCGLAIRPSDEDTNGNVTIAFRAQTKSKGQGRPVGSTNKPKN